MLSFVTMLLVALAVVVDKEPIVDRKGEQDLEPWELGVQQTSICRSVPQYRCQGIYIAQLHQDKATVRPVQKKRPNQAR